MKEDTSISKRCPGHRDKDTMVPCLECGRDFCRLCDPPKGSGQYCRACYDKSLAQLESKKAGRKKPEKAKSAPRGLRARLAGRKTARMEASGAKAEKAGRKTDKTGRKGERASGKARKTGGKAAGEPGSGGGAEAGRWARLKSGRGFTRITVFRGFPRRAARAAWAGLKTAGFRVARVPGVAWRWNVDAAVRSARFVRSHFPLSIEDRVAWQGEPALAAVWWKVLAVVLGGTGLWIMVVLLTRKRLMVFSVGVALLMTGFIIWALGARYGMAAGVIAASLVLLALVLGEFTVQMLFRLGVIKKLDFVRYWKGADPAVLYRNYYKSFFVRMMPSLAASFVLAWWPLPKRLGWIGFSGRTLEEVEAPESHDKGAVAGAPPKAG